MPRGRKLQSPFFPLPLSFVQTFFSSNIYSVVACLSLFVHLIINWKQLFVWRTLPPRPGARELRHFLACLTVFFVSDVLWGVFAGLKWRMLLYADTVLFFLAMALTVFAWTHFVAAYLELDGRPRVRLLWTGRGMTAFFVFALIANLFNGWMFTIDGTCQYAAGPLRQVAFWLLVAINGYDAFATFGELRRTEGATRRRNTMIFAVGVTMAVAIVFQLPDPLLPIYGLGCLFGICLLHVFVVEDEHDEFLRKEMLARDVAAQLDAAHATAYAKRLFFSSVSHDIRTPLNAIVGFSELLAQGGTDDGDRARYIASIRSSAKVLARLVDDILDLSKLESGKLEILEEPTDVETLVREVIAACEVARARKGLALRAEIGQVPTLRVDPQRLRQILFNLLSNACKYTDRGTVSVRVRWHGGTLTLAVADTGKGISKEDMERILQPFVQAADRNHRDGTGLGLPICRKLAALMGGELAVESEPGKGSTFTVTLHGIRTADAPIRRRTERPTGQVRLPSRVLLVDDSSVNRAVLKAMLAKIGVTDVTLAENGREALALLKGGTGFDLVLTDLWMPELDGRGLVQAIRADEAVAHLPVHLVTADVEARQRAAEDGFTGVLLKPISLTRLQALFAEPRAEA